MRTTLSPWLLLAICNVCSALDRVDLCGTEAYSTGYNASGSLTVSGFRVNDTYPKTDWTWTRYVTDVKNPGGSESSLWQTFGLETKPELNLSDPSLPYTGCIIVPSSVIVAGREDDGSCSGIFNHGCISEIFAKVNATAALLSGTQRGSTPSFSCPQLIQAITTSASSKCYDQWRGSTSTEFLPSDFSGDLTSRHCVPKNQTGHPFFGWAKDPNPETDYRDYDQAIRTPHPIIVAVWLKATTDQEPQDPKNRHPGWADTRLFCIPANNTEPGSRSLATANRAAGGAAGRKEIWNRGTVLLGVGAVVVLGLAL